MEVKFKIPHVNTSIRWVLDWKIPYFPNKSEKILISCFLPDDIKNKLSKVKLGEWLQEVEEEQTFDIPENFLFEMGKIERKLAEEDKKKTNIYDLFLSYPCIISDVIWLRNDAGVLQAYLEISLDFEIILSNI